MLNDFISATRGTLVSFDNVTARAGESMQLVAAWCKYIGLPFRWPAPRDWPLDRNDDNFYEYWAYFRIVDMNDEERPRAGDIVIFEDNLPGSDGKGHASIFVEDDGMNWRGFDSDWEGELAHTQYHDWMFVRGWFTPILPIQELPQTTQIVSRKNSMASMVSPVRVGDSKDVLLISEHIPRYPSMSAALAQKGNTGTVPIRQYYVYRRLNGMMHLTRELGQPSGIWINPADLEPKKPEPVVTAPEPPKTPPLPPSPASITPVEQMNIRTLPPLPRQGKAARPLRTQSTQSRYVRLYLWMLTLKEKYKEL